MIRFFVCESNAYGEAVKTVRTIKRLSNLICVSRFRPKIGDQHARQTVHTATAVIGDGFSQHFERGLRPEQLSRACDGEIVTFHVTQHLECVD